MKSKNVTSENINKYIESLKSQLLIAYPSDDVNNILYIVRNKIDDFVSDNPSATMNDVENYIKININDFMQAGIRNIEPAALKEKLTRNHLEKKKNKLIIGIVATLILILAVYCIYDLYIIKKYSPAYVTEEIIVLDETVYPDETDSTEFSSESSSESTE